MSFDLLSLFALPQAERQRLEAALRSSRRVSLTWDSVTGYLSTLKFKDRDENVLFTWTFTWDAATGNLLDILRS